MKESLRILILEDSCIDAELIQFELKEARISFNAKVVTSEKDFLRELNEFAPDLIISDYNLPAYNGCLALADVKRRFPDIPYILVTGALVEERAIGILCDGAEDYVIKSRLQQELAPAIMRTLAEMEEKNKGKGWEVELRKVYRAVEALVKIRIAELEAGATSHGKKEEVLWRGAPRKFMPSDCLEWEESGKGMP